MKPAVVIVPGAWHVPEHYEPLVSQLTAASFEVYTPALPTCGKLAAQSTFEDDRSTVHKQLRSLVDDHARKVVVLAHSYGGAVATQALEGDILFYQDRAKQKLEGGVVHLIYMCAFMLQPGESCLSISQPRPEPDPVSPGDDGTSFIRQPAREPFYADVDVELAKASETLLVRHNRGAIATPISYPAWRHLPTTYLRCTEDRVLFPDWQNRMLKAVKDTGTVIEVETFKASHSPFLSLTKEMAGVVEKVAAMYE